MTLCFSRNLNLGVWMVLLCGWAWGAQDPQQTSSKPVDFSQALTTVLERDPQLQKVRAQEMETQSTAKISQYHLLPKIDLLANHHFPTSPLHFTQSSQQFIGLELDWNFFSFGKDEALFQSAMSTALSKQEERIFKVLETEQSTLQAWVQYLAAQEQVRIVKDIVQMREISSTIAQVRFKKGLLAQQEVEKIKIDLSNDKAKLSEALFHLTEKKEQIRQLLGHTHLKPQWPYKRQLEQQVSLEVLDGLPLKNHPLRSRQLHLLEAARSAQRSQWGKLFPTLHLVGSYGSRRDPSQGWTDQGALGIELRFELFNRTQDYFGYEASIYRSLAEEAQLTFVERSVLREFQTEREAFLIFNQAALERQQALLSSRKLYDSSLQRFKKGLLSANELIVDQNRLYDSERFAVIGWLEAHLHLGRLCQSVGLRLEPCVRQIYPNLNY